MNAIEPRPFATLCYLVLMDHHGDGVAEAHPNYASEKLPMIDAGYDAYVYLDRPNQETVKRLLTKWGYEEPKPVKEFEKAFDDDGVIW